MTRKSTLLLLMGFMAVTNLYSFEPAKEESNGDRRDDLVFDVDKNIFCVNEALMASVNVRL